MKTIHLALACLLLNAYGCSNAAYDNKEASEEAPAHVQFGNAQTDSISQNGFISSSAARLGKDTSRKFIRTAEMKFRAKNVYRSTYAIEDIAEKHMGFVTLSDLRSTVTRTERTPVSADSLLETTYYSVENRISMRVPNYSLDSTLREIASQIEFLDYRVIKAEDVSLQLMVNKWREKRAGKHYDRLKNAIDHRGKKLRETVEAEEALASKEETADYMRMDNLSMIDRMNYSTIDLVVYQRETIRHELLPNPKDIRIYEPGFFSNVGASLRDGWNFLESFVLFLLKLWPLVPIALVLWIVLRRYYKKP